MQNEDNDIKDIPLILDDRNNLMDDSSILFRDMDEIYKIDEIKDYSILSLDRSKIKKKSKTIGTITGIGISSLGVLTFLVAIIFSMMTNNTFKPTITNPKIEIVSELKNAISYSFSYTNPYGIAMYCDLKTDKEESLFKTKISGIGTFEGVFSDLEYDTDYTFYIYSEQYGSKVSYFESDLIHIEEFLDSDFKMDYSIIDNEDRILNYKLKYPYEERSYWQDFRFIIETDDGLYLSYSIEAMEGYIIINDINSSFLLTVLCYDKEEEERKVLTKISVDIGESNGERD